MPSEWIRNWITIPWYEDTNNNNNLILSDILLICEILQFVIKLWLITSVITEINNIQRGSN